MDAINIVYLVSGVYALVLIAGVILGYMAWKKRDVSTVFGEHSVLHLMLGVIFPYVEIIPAIVELSR